MAPKQTDWTKEKKKLQDVNTGKPLPRIEYWDDPGTVLLKSGTRKSVGNEGLPYESKDQIIEAIETNRRYRERHQRSAMQKRVDEAKKRNPKTLRDRLKGLFGGG